MSAFKDKHPDALPWLTYEAILWLYGRVKEDWQVWEWGSGSSTYFWSAHCAGIHTVEHDPQWCLEITERLKGRNNVEMIHVPASKKNYGNKIYDEPLAYYSKAKQLFFKEYAQAIDARPDDSFDLVIVDGRARPSCLLHALPKVKPGGLLLLDNSERAHYAKAMREVPSDWRVHHFQGPGRKIPHQPAPFAKPLNWRTTIWRRVV